MQLTFNGVEPHRVFYNDELVKKIYMNDKLVYAYYPNNQILFCPSENDLNELNSNIKELIHTSGEGLYPEATYKDRVSYVAPVDGTYKITVESEYYAGYVNLYLYEGDIVSFFPQYATPYSIGEWLYKRRQEHTDELSDPSTGHYVGGNLSYSERTMTLISFYRGSSAKSWQSTTVTVDLTILESILNVGLDKFNDGHKTGRYTLPFECIGGNAINNIRVTKPPSNYSSTHYISPDAKYIGVNRVIIERI